MLLLSGSNIANFVTRNATALISNPFVTFASSSVQAYYFQFNINFALYAILFVLINQRIYSKFNLILITLK